LNTVDELKGELRALGLPLGGAKAELIERLRKTSNRYKFFEDVVRDHSGFKLLSKQDMEACLQISEKIRTNPALEVLFAEGDAEVTMIWEDAETGVLCKARADWLTPGGICLDPKSTTDASPTEFAWSIKKFRYYRQAAWYLDAIAATMRIEGTFLFAAFETTPPYASAIYAPDRDMIEEGRSENRALLARYAECKKTGNWPGYGDEIMPISLPRKKHAETRSANLETY
jgi:SAP domain.